MIEQIDLVVSKIEDWIVNTVNDAGADGVVIGLSGGIDSAVVASLATRALGKEKVHGVSIPILFDSGSEYAFAHERLGIGYEEIQGGGIVMSFEQAVMKGKGHIEGLALANLHARVRMSILRVIAPQKNYLVIGTGNRSEHVIGYFTKAGGDGDPDFEPILDFYKSEVYQIAEYLGNIPSGTMKAKPSAGLWEGQTDEGELGFTYKDLEVYAKYNIDDDFTITSEYEAMSEKTKALIADVIIRNGHKTKAIPWFSVEEHIDD